MTLLLFVMPAFVAALLAYGLTPVARRLAFRIDAVDYPGPRKIHSVPTPRLGGLAVVFSSTIVFALISWFAPAKLRALPPQLLLGVAVGLLPIAIISFFDDIRPKRAIVKFGVHLMAASLAVAFGIRLYPDVHFLGTPIHIGWLAIPISIIWLAGITNAFNLIDGLDGLSAGLALISAVSLGAVSIVTHHYEMAAAASILAGSLIGFLPFNLYPARIYLGDSGATAIGFFLGALTLSGGSTTTAGLAVTLPIVVLGIPLADTLLSMTRRLLRNTESTEGGMFVADRNHIHHRLLALGFDQRSAVLLLYGVGLVLALFAFASVFLRQQDAALLLGALLVAAVVGVSRLGYDEFAMVKRGVVLRMYDAPVLKKGFFVVFVDLAMIATALYVAIGLKYDDWSIVEQRKMIVGIMAILPAATLMMFSIMHIYRRSWSNAGIQDVVKLTMAVVTANSATYVVARLTATQPPTVTFMVTYTLVMLALVNGTRASYRVFYQMNRESNLDGDPVVIYGAGRGGALALREILCNVDVPMRPIGFIDDNPQMKGRYINGYPVLGNLDDLSSVVLDGKARGVVIASEKIPITKVQDAQKVCQSRGAWMRVFTVDFRAFGDRPTGTA